MCLETIYVKLIKHDARRTLERASQSYPHKSVRKVMGIHTAGGFKQTNWQSWDRSTLIGAIQGMTFCKEKI